MDVEIRKQIAGNILEQLGGNKFLAMTGAKNLAFGANGELTFELPRYAGLKINYININLNGKDLYDMEFGRIYGMKYTVLETHKDIYNDMLQSIFAKTTGLDTHL